MAIAALYARVSTADQTPENQLIQLRKFAAARGFAEVEEFVDWGVSGSLDSRPALDSLMRAARMRRIHTVVCVSLDRFGRHLKHLVTAIDELALNGVGFVSLNESLATDTPSGKLQFHVLAALAEFEKARLADRTRAGIIRARLEGKQIGRPRRTALPPDVPAITVRDAARIWGVSKSTAARRLASGLVPSGTTVQNPPNDLGAI